MEDFLYLVMFLFLHFLFTCIACSSTMQGKDRNTVYEERLFTIFYVLIFIHSYETNFPSYLHRGLRSVYLSHLSMTNLIETFLECSPGLLRPF